MRLLFNDLGCNTPPLPSLLMSSIGLAEKSFGFFCNILQKNPNKLFGQPNTTAGTFGGYRYLVVIEAIGIR